MENVSTDEILDARKKAYANHNKGRTNRKWLLKILERAYAGEYVPENAILYARNEFKFDG